MATMSTIPVLAERAGAAAGPPSLDEKRRSTDSLCRAQTAMPLSRSRLLADGAQRWETEIAVRTLRVFAVSQVRDG